MPVNKTLKWAGALALCVSLSGCTTISDWFTDDEELAIKRLSPIEAKFQPEIIWSTDLTGGVGRHFSRLRPAVGYDLVFAASRQGTVAAFDPQSGKTVWEQNFATFENEGYFSFLSNMWSDGISAKIAGGLTLGYNAVFLGTENGEVISLDAKTGEINWQVKVKGEVLAAPAVDESVVVVNTGSGVMFGLDASTGEQLWRYESEVPALSLRGISAPAVGGGGALVGTASGKLAVTLLATGQTAWEQPVAAPSGATELDRIADIDSRPLIFSGIVYVVSFDGTLAAVELRSGRVIWKREYKSYRRLSMFANRLFVTDVGGYLYGLDRRNGVELWSQGGLKGRQVTAGEPVGQYIVVGDKYGYLHWIDQSDGSIVARVAVGDDDEDEGIYSAPVSAGQVLYTQTRDGVLAAVRTPDN